MVITFDTTLRAAEKHQRARDGGTNPTRLEIRYFSLLTSVHFPLSTYLKTWNNMEVIPCEIRRELHGESTSLLFSPPLSLSDIISSFLARHEVSADLFSPLQKQAPG